jgi:hypothetical protein
MASKEDNEGTLARTLSEGVTKAKVLSLDSIE